MNNYQRPAPRPREEGWENAAFVGVLALLGFGFVLWATGEISALVASGQRADASFSQMGQVLVNLVEHASDPKMAWPRSARAHMSGPVLFYGVLIALIVAAGGIGLAVFRIFKGTFSNGSPGSSWAGIRDLRQLVIKQPQPGRLTLGRVGGRLVAAEERQSVIVLGPTQSMKTTGFAIPAILEWEGPVLCGIFEPMLAILCLLAGSNAVLIT